MRKYLYTWLVPLLWAVSSLLSLRFPGDEYGLYTVSSIAGVWGYLLFRPSGSPSNTLFWLTITIAGMLVMSVFGFVLSKLRAKIVLFGAIYAAAAIVFCVFLICSYPSFEKAISKNGSLWAYVFSSMNLGLYVSVILTAIISGISKLVRPKR